MEEEISNQIKRTLYDLTAKVDELSKSIGETIGETKEYVGEKKEYAEGQINENPLAYVAGAFIGGVLVGYVMGSGKR
jgi:hypothetical protein